MSKDLALRAFEARGRALRTSQEVVVQPAVPVLYFGDHKAYLGSNTKVVTVALNPSNAEFPGANSYQRFPLARGLTAPSDGYIASLDAYFTTDPYRRWFSSFEPVLNGIDASYYPGKENTALHTDICSPVATSPTWTRLDSDIRNTLIEDGAPLWHALLSELKPDVVLISLARHHLKKIEFPSDEPFELARLEQGRRYPYVTTA